MQGAQFSSGYCTRLSGGNNGTTPTPPADSPTTPPNNTKCPFRTVPKDGKCVHVSDLCKDWDRATGDCSECYGGYNLRGGKCNL